MVIELGQERIRMRGEIMATLRGATRKAHDSYDIAVNLDHLLNSRSHYRAHLVRLYGFFTALEFKMESGYESFNDAGVDLRDRRKSAALLMDLVSLGVRKKDADSIPLCFDLPDVSTPERLLGAVYVMEEATIGGQFICQLVTQKLGVSPERGGRFFFGYGNETGLMWKRYCDLLEQLIITPEQRWDLISGALESFEKLEKWITIQS